MQNPSETETDKAQPANATANATTHANVNVDANNAQPTNTDSTTNADNDASPTANTDNAQTTPTDATNTGPQTSPNSPNAENADAKNAIDDNGITTNMDMIDISSQFADLDPLTDALADAALTLAPPAMKILVGALIRKPTKDEVDTLQSQIETALSYYKKHLKSLKDTKNSVPDKQDLRKILLCLEKDDGLSPSFAVKNNGFGFLPYHSPFKKTYDDLLSKVVYVEKASYIVERKMHNIHNSKLKDDFSANINYIVANFNKDLRKVCAYLERLDTQFAIFKMVFIALMEAKKLAKDAIDATVSDFSM